MVEFESYVYEFEHNRSQGEGVTIEGPCASSIAWIPFYADMNDMPECAYKTHPLLTHSRVHPSAVSMLFVSGNPSDLSSDGNPSPTGFSDRTHFLRLIESKNYRGALALDELKLTLTKRHLPLRISFKQFSDVGYTPIRVGYNRRYLTYHDKGRGSTNPNFEPYYDDEFVTVHRWIRLKIGRAGELGGFMLTGRRAPSALLSIEYAFRTNGDVSVCFGGSSIPSQSYYINWAREGLHDMMTNASAEITGFLDAGSCKDAPAKSLLERSRRCVW